MNVVRQVGALEFYCIDECSLDGTANVVMLIGSGISDTGGAFTVVDRCVCVCVNRRLRRRWWPQRGPNESCVGEHMDHSCGLRFQMEVVSKERCAETLMIVDEVNGYTCVCDEEDELVLLVNGSLCVAKECEIFPRTWFSETDVNVNVKVRRCRGSFEKIISECSNVDRGSAM